MMEVSVRELKSRLSEYLRKLKSGDEITVTSHGKPVARLLPPRGQQSKRSVEENAIERLRSQPWVRPGRVGKKRVGLARPIKLKPGEKTLSDIVSEMRD
jgi:prevent-host-death family protein